MTVTIDASELDSAPAPAPTTETRPWPGTDVATIKRERGDKLRSLWAIEADLAALEELADDEAGELAGCEPILDEWFLQLGTEAAKKIDGYAAFIAELNARADARKEEAARLTHRAEVDAKLAAWLKSRLLDFFRLRDWKKLETSRYKISRCANGGKTPLRLFVEPEKLPPEFRREKVVYSADSDKIRQAIEEGEILEFAKLEERGEHLRIK